jgi:hypothetical protein
MPRQLENKKEKIGPENLQQYPVLSFHLHRQIGFFENIETESEKLLFSYRQRKQTKLCIS